MAAPAKKLLGCWCNGACPHAPMIRAAAAGAGRNAAGETAARRALTDAPNCAEAHRALAHFLTENNRAHLAGEHLARAAAIAGDSPALALQAASNFRQQAKIAAAIAAGKRARALSPANIAAHIALAIAYEAAGELEAARETIADAEKIFGAGGAKPLRRIAAMVDAAGGDYARAVERLAGDDLAPVELFDRGRFREKLKDYAGAWSDWMEGKRIQREKEGAHYDAEKLEAKFAALHEIARRFKYLKGAPMPADLPAPLFITGFPRSGTTMIEAALSAHPQIAAGDELPFLPELVERLPLFLNARAPYPRAMMAMAWPENETVLPLLQRFYIGKAIQKIYGAWPPGTLTQAMRLSGDLKALAFFTDKMPSNELHWPLLALLFPESPIVHCRRHPLDILLSCMSHHLVGGAFNACALEWCARHYALTDDLTAHYREKLPLPMLREVRYESFVQDHAGGIDALLEFCALEPDERCHNFHLSDWQSHTLSYRQIKEPAHARSVGRYKPFLEFLRPIVPTIQATLDREGYEL